MGVEWGGRNEWASCQSHRERTAALARATRGERRPLWWVRLLDRIWGVTA